jgi:hypothetical protein
MGKPPAAFSSRTALETDSAGYVGARRRLGFCAEWRLASRVVMATSPAPIASVPDDLRTCRLRACIATPLGPLPAAPRPVKEPISGGSYGSTATQSFFKPRVSPLFQCGGRPRARGGVRLDRFRASRSSRQTDDALGSGRPGWTVLVSALPELGSAFDAASRCRTLAIPASVQFATAHHQSFHAQDCATVWGVIV